MKDHADYGRTKAEIVSLFSNIQGWTTSGTGLNSEAFGVTELPYLIGVTRNEDRPTEITLFEGGFGREDSPYTITNWNQLQNINHSNILTQGYYFTLLNDLTTSTEGYTTQVSNGDTLANNGKGWNTIGDESHMFIGKFDGLNHTIYNLTIKRPDSNYIGLFGIMGKSSIKNIGLSNVNIEGEDKVGGLIGHIYNGYILNSYVSGNVSGNGYVGGLVGENYGTIVNSYVLGNVSGNGYIGGLVGLNESGGNIENSYVSGTVNGNENIGGLVGINHDLIKDSYVLGTVSGDNQVGGLVGINNGTIESTYYSGNVSGNVSMGLVGSESYGTITNSFYDKTKAGKTASIEGVTALTSEEMSYGKIYKDASWDIVVDNSVTSLTPIIKYDNENNKYVWVISPLALNYNLASKSTTYNGTIQDLNDIYTTNDIFTDKYNFLNLDYKFQKDGEDLTGYKNAGTYKNIKIALNGNDEFVSIANSGNSDGTLTINKKAITVTAEDKSKTYGDTNPNLTYTTTGLINEDTLNGNLSTTASETSDVGTYDISQGSLANSNYDITFTDGKLTITPKTITVTADDKSKTYGDTNPELTYTTTGLINKDTLSGNLSTTASETSDVGTYDISQGSLANNNYDITFTQGTLTVLAKDEPTPEPTPEPTINNDIKKVITTIVNQEAIKSVVPKIEISTPLNNGKNTNIVFLKGENKIIVSKPIKGQNTKKITLSQAKKMQEEATGKRVKEVKIPLSRSSQIVLVNGGINLPLGIEQEFYIEDKEK